MADRPVSVRRLETAAPWPPAVLKWFGDGVIFTVKWQIALSPFGGWKPPLLGLRRFEAFGIRQGFGDGAIFIVKWQIALSLFGGWKPPLLGLRRF